MPSWNLEYIIIHKHLLSGRNKIKGDESLENDIGGGAYILDRVTVGGRTAFMCNWWGTGRGRG